MGFEAGKPRPENAGRKPGSLNKRSHLAIEIAEGLECNPIEFLCYVVKGDVAKLKDAPDLDQRISAAKELSSYLFPKLKSVEHSGEINGAEVFSKLLDELNGSK